MKYAVIAAGQGTRLSSEGINVPKPLVQLCGETLADRLIRIFMNNDAEEIIVVCNETMPQVARHLAQVAQRGIHGRDVPLHIIQRNTESSMHSLYEMRYRLKQSPFCLTTVDTIFDEKTFTKYIQSFNQAIQNGVDALMGVTAFVDDEKPLYVDVNRDMQVKGFYDEMHHCRYISGGIYGLQSNALEILQRCVEKGEQRMRNFQRSLLAEGLCVKAFDMGCVFDIDHAADIEKAETYLKHQT